MGKLGTENFQDLGKYALLDSALISAPHFGPTAGSGDPGSGM